MTSPPTPALPANQQFAPRPACTCEATDADTAVCTAVVLSLKPLAGREQIVKQRCHS